MNSAHPLDRLLLRRGGILLLSNTVGQGLAFLTSIALGRLLGVTAFGQYAAIMALVLVLGIVVDAGLEVSLTRAVARTPGRGGALLAAALLAKGAIGGVLALGLALPPVAVALAPAPDSVPALQLAGLLVILNALNGSFSALFRAWGQMASVLLINVAGLSVQLAGAIILLLLAPNVVYLIAWLIVVQVGELAGGVLLFRRGARALARPAGTAPIAAPGGIAGWRAAGAEGARLVRASWPFLLAGLIGTLTIRVDLFLIEALRGAAAVGIYSVATRLLELLGLIPNSFFAALLPALTAEASGDSGAALYGRTVRRMALAGVVGAGAGLLLAEVLVGLSFGPAYADAAAPLRILSLGLIPLLINRTTTLQLYATGREGLATRVQAGNLALRAGLGWALVSLWGAPGAAVAALLAESATLAVFWRLGAMRDADPVLVHRGDAETRRTTNI